MGCGVRPAGEGNPAWNGRLHPAHRHLGRVPMAKDLAQEMSEGGWASIAGMGPPPPWPQAQCEGACGYA